jgi:hypothetical protein
MDTDDGHDPDVFEALRGIEEYPTPNRHGGRENGCILI